MLWDFFPWSVPLVLGHTAWKNGEAHQSGEQSKEMVQSSQRGRGPERVAIGVSESRGFYGLLGGLF